MSTRKKIKAVEYRAYDTPDGYVNAIRQLSKQGYNYFLPVDKTRRRSSMMIGKVSMPRTQATLH